jgi:DNA-directed RNA polymerase subunit RPC12/RpoP
MRTKKVAGKKKRSTLKKYVRSSPTRTKSINVKERKKKQKYVRSSPTHTKKVVDKKKRSTLKKYVCSSPTCAKVFEKPKVVRYLACPYCLSKIEKTDQAKNLRACVIAEEKRESEIKPVTSNESVESQIQNKPVIAEEKRESEIVRLKTSILARARAIFQESEAPEKVELAPSGEIPGKIKDVRSKDGQCKYYFGYLSKRKKGEGIPEACVECPKSIDCLLSNLYESPTAVSEIKKWYNILPAS